jgi:hypothetical protein
LTHHRITFDDSLLLIAQPPHFTTSLATLFGDMDLAVVDRFESSSIELKIKRQNK